MSDTSDFSHLSNVDRAQLVALANELERRECARSPWYFVLKYCRTSDKHDPSVIAKPFPNKPHLAAMAQHWLENRMLIILKSRQIMATHLMACLHLWLALFHNNQRVFFSSKKESDAHDLVERSYFAYEHLPSFLKVGVYARYKQCHLEFFRSPTDEIAYSEIYATPSGADILRQHTASAVFADEFAFQISQEAMLTAAAPTVLGGGKMTLQSSAEPGIFETLCEDKTENEKEQVARGITRWTTSRKFSVLRVHFAADPEKDPSTDSGKRYVIDSHAALTDAEWSKEYDIDFGAVGGSLVFPEFDPDVHLVDPFFLDPSQWTCYMALDCHPREFHAMLWLCVSKYGDWCIPCSHWLPRDQLDEKRPMFVKKYIRLILDIEKDRGLKPIKRIMDVAGRGMFLGDTDAPPFDFFEAYRNENPGLHFYESQKNRGYFGFDPIHEALSEALYTKTLTITRRGQQIGEANVTQEVRPRLYIFKKYNEELCFEISKYRWRRWKVDEPGRAEPQKPEEGRDHLISCLSYLALDRPQFVRSEPGRDDWQYNPNTKSTGY